MAITKQDYKNIYSMLPPEKNEKGDSSLGLGKMVENLIPPYEEWVETRDTYNYCYGWFVVNLKEGGFYRLQSSADLYKPIILNGVKNNISTETDQMKNETYNVHVIIGDKKYDTLSFLWEFSNVNSILYIQLKNKNEEKTIGSCTFNSNVTFDDQHLGTMVWQEESIYIEAMITNFSETDTPLLYKCFIKEYSASQSYTANFFYSEKRDLVLGVFEPGSFKNMRSIFYHKLKNAAPLLLCLFKSDLPWVVDLNNIIVGMDWKEPDIENKVYLDEPEKELPAQNIKSWFDSVDLEIGDDGLLYAINPLYENKDLLSSSTIIMPINGVEQSGEIKLIPNRLYLTSIEQNSNYVIRNGSQKAYKINQNTTRYLRQIYDKQKDTAENKQNKGGQNYNKPRTWVYWPQATMDQEKILLCTGNEIDGVKDNKWSDFRLLSKNDIKEENYTSIEYVWTFVYKDSENITHYIMMGKSQPIVINKDSTNEIPLIQKNFGDEYYSNPYIFID